MMSAAREMIPSSQRAEHLRREELSYGDVGSPSAHCQGGKIMRPRTWHLSAFKTPTMNTAARAAMMAMLPMASNQSDCGTGSSMRLSHGFRTAFRPQPMSITSACDKLGDALGTNEAVGPTSCRLYPAAASISQPQPAVIIKDTAGCSGIATPPCSITAPPSPWWAARQPRRPVANVDRTRSQAQLAGGQAEEGGENGGVCDLAVPAGIIGPGARSAISRR